eukprot:m.154957 g.154957  ORF g.154957 m.154957 type:complete len:62 (+) comp16264_c1_seq6:544-729(+)
MFVFVCGFICFFPFGDLDSLSGKNEAKKQNVQFVVVTLLHAAFVCCFCFLFLLFVSLFILF